MAPFAHKMNTYEPIVNPELQALLEHADSLKEQLDRYRPLQEKEHLWSSIQEKLRAEWTYHSNAIEGNTLTLGETIYFLRYGLTIEGRPLKDFLEARNHAEAIDLLYHFVSDERLLSESFIKEINALLLLGVSSTPALNQFGKMMNKPATPGRYKNLPNSVLRPDGSVHEYVPPLQVASEMEILCNWINSHIDSLHPIVVGALAHYNMVRIHPFDDGNGRGARILMNLILIKKKYLPAVIKIEQRRKYIDTLNEANQGDLSQFIAFIAEASIQTQKVMLDILNNKVRPTG